MVSSLGATYRPLWALLQRTGASRFRLAMALALMLVAGALESASFGLLVPLLATVTGGATAGDALSRLFPPGVGPNGAFLHDDPFTYNNNVFDFITPGIVISGLGDADRDGINAWDGSFRMSGGNYTASVAQSETPGKDNEFVIIHR